MKEAERSTASARSQADLDLLERFILVRMLPGKKPPTRSKLLADLKPYFAVPQGLSNAAWSELLDAHLDRLVDAGYLSRRPYALTRSGRERALEVLGLDSVPANCRWSTLKSRYLMARALGVEPRGRGDWERIGDGQEGFKAALLARLFDLPVNRLPTLNQVIAALAASRGLRPARNDVNSLREAALRRWVEQEGRPLSADGTSTQSAPSSRTSGPPSQAHPNAGPTSKPPTARGDDATGSDVAEADLAAFADKVLRIARASPPAKGGEKVFLRHVWERFQRDPSAAGITREQFDARLIEASRRGLLTLSRADLVVPVDPEDVRASEVRLPHGGTVHFVRIDRGRT